MAAKSQKKSNKSLKMLRADSGEEFILAKLKNICN